MIAAVIPVNILTLLMTPLRWQREDGRAYSLLEFLIDKNRAYNLESALSREPTKPIDLFTLEFLLSDRDLNTINFPAIAELMSSGTFSWLMAHTNHKKHYGLMSTLFFALLTEGNNDEGLSRCTEYFTPDEISQPIADDELNPTTFTSASSSASSSDSAGHASARVVSTSKSS